MKKKQSENHLLFVGLNTIDLQFLVPAYPEANSKTKAKSNRIFVGGPATNAAIASAYLGAEVDLCTPIGKHTLTAFIVEDLRRHNIRVVDPIAKRKSAPVFASIITSEENGDRTVFSYHPEREVMFSNETALDISRYRLALFDGFHLEVAVPLARECRRQGVITVLDGGSWKPGIDRLLKNIDIAICSNDFSVPKGKRADDVFRQLHADGIPHVAITRGEKNILFSTDNHLGEIEIDPVDAVDTLGAGDIFHGAFGYYHAMGSPFEEALEKAAQIASKSCLSLGTREWMNAG